MSDTIYIPGHGELTRDEYERVVVPALDYAPWWQQVHVALWLIFNKKRAKHLFAGLLEGRMWKSAYDKTRRCKGDEH